MSDNVNICGEEQVYIPDYEVNCECDCVEIDSRIKSLKNTKQDKLTAGYGISIEDNVVSTVLSSGYTHNAVYREKLLGVNVSDAQYESIKAGTFDDMYIGDYWLINGVIWRIAAFDYYYGTGDATCTTHHVVIVPDTCLTTAQINQTATTSGGYAGSYMYTTPDYGLFACHPIIIKAFGESHLLTWRNYLLNAMDGGNYNGFSWYDCIVECMSCLHVFGSVFYGTSAISYDTLEHSQFPLFTLNPYNISHQESYWLKEPSGSATFLRITVEGIIHGDYTNQTYGIRPYFCLKA